MYKYFKFLQSISIFCETRSQRGYDVERKKGFSDYSNQKYLLSLNICCFMCFIEIIDTGVYIFKDKYSENSMNSLYAPWNISLASSRPKNFKPLDIQRIV